MEINTVPGDQCTGWEKGEGDYVLRPDVGTLRLAPGCRG